MSDRQETDRRLHPLSILFDIAGTVRSFIVPVVIAVFASRSERILIYSSAIIGSLSIIGAIWNWFTYRFRYDENDLVVRSGKFIRNERHIPYNRIQNIDAVQNVAHRLFGVAIVQVQTGSGTEPEATMKVLPLSALAEMRERVFAKGGSSAHASVDAATVDPTSDVPDGHEVHARDVRAGTRSHTAKLPPVTLLHLPPRELLLAGLIENRGMALIVASIAALSRFDPLEEMFIDRLETWIPEWAKVNPNAEVAAHIGGFLVVGVVALLFLLLVVRAISTLWALIRLYDFTLVRDGDDLRAEYGLFTRVTSTIPVHRVQTISLHQRLLHRKTNRAAIRVTTAGGAGMSEEGTKSREREWLAPIVPYDKVIPLLRQVDESISFDDIAWQGAHPRAMLRLFRVSTAWAAALTAVAAYFVGWLALVLGALLLVRAVARSRGIVRNLGAAMVDGRAFFRSGWFDRVITVVRFERIQSASLSQSVFDRRARMATVSVDSAGTGKTSLQMPYMSREEAVVFHERLAQAAVATPFVW